jgi:hypothetical protein
MGDQAGLGDLGQARVSLEVNKLSLVMPYLEATAAPPEGGRGGGEL